MQKPMCSSSSTPRSSPPLTMSSRFTLRAKALSFIRLSDRLHVNFGKRLAGLDQGNSGDESRKFVAGEERFLHRRIAGDAGVFRMRHDGAADFVGVAALLEDFVAFVGMFFGRGPALVIEIVNEADNAPESFRFRRPVCRTFSNTRACRPPRPRRACAGFRTE